MTGLAEREAPSSTRSLAAILAAGRHAAIPAAPDLWGHGGLHGGLTLAALAAAAGVPENHRIRSVTGQFLRPVTDAVDLAVHEARHGRTVRSVDVRAVSDGSVRATATVTTGTEGGTTMPVRVSTPAPTVPPVDDCAVLALPDENAPIVSHFEIRPASGAHPFSGSDEPELTAWIRLTDEGSPPDTLGLIVLADAIAASYTAVLPVLALTPTLELTVAPTGRCASSPWVLVRARSRAVSDDGWIDEHVDLWDETGAHLATARQLRLAILL